MRVSAEGACEIAHKALPRKRHRRSDEKYDDRLTTLSAPFPELNGHCVNAVRLYIYAADVLVRLGVDKGDSI